MEKGLEDLREQIQDFREGCTDKFSRCHMRSSCPSKQGHEHVCPHGVKVSAWVMATHEALRVEVPKPYTFNGNRDAKELDNFLCHMERYFEAIALMDEATKREIKRQFYLEDVTYLAGKHEMSQAHGLIHEFVNEFSMLMLEIPNMSEEELLFNFMDNFLCHMERYFEAIALMDEATKVRTTTVYLLDNATLWWCWRFGDIEKRTYTIDMWDAFKREIKRQFYLEDVAYLARKNMKCLKHTGLIREFVKEFFMLMLEIPNMFEEELLFNFLDNLQS
ncbi:hypothetical protein CK203_089257 [Vitis vinifera]|uniref:Retrotransposon gag domain-containing protein n=1 Tax=Vitis vinifera TaxID=29760 RepID=A0A438CZY2_VITVI|nr:hypothetical protein CK203_089257 [Vitis vinifera]